MDPVDKAGKTVCIEIYPSGTDLAQHSGMRSRPRLIRLTSHRTDLFLRACPIPECGSAAICRLDYNGSVIGNCRGCEWVGMYEDLEVPQILLATK